MILAIGAGILMGIPAIIVDSPPEGDDLSSSALAIVQLATALGFAMVPMAIAARRGADFREALRRLGVRAFRPSAVGWMFAAIGAYLLFAIVYTTIFGVPEQEDIAESLGSVPVQILLIVVAAPIAEEICFRGMLYGGLRERWPKVAAALLAGLIFGALHALTGLSTVPSLVAFGFVLCLLYERTGSIVPGIVLHMLNNSAALLAQ